MSETDFLTVSLTKRCSKIKFISQNQAQRAVERVEKAIEADLEHDYVEAYRLYCNSTDYFMLALKCEASEISPPPIKTIHYHLAGYPTQILYPSVLFDSFSPLTY